MLSSLSQQFLNHAIGSENISQLLNSRVVFSSLVYKEGNKMNLLVKNENTPVFIEDWRIYLLIRAICKSWIVTGKILRDEKDAKSHTDIDFGEYDEIKELYYMYKKKIVVLSKSMSEEDLNSVPFFSSHAYDKFINYNESVSKEVYAKYDISDVGTGDISFETSVEFLENNSKGNLPVLAEIGPQTFKEVLPSNMIDFILLSVYSGEIEENVKGIPFPYEELIQNSNYKLVHESEPIHSQKGFLTFYTYVKA